MKSTVTVKIDSEEYTVYPIKNDVNGNARYVIHYLAFHIQEYDAVSRYGFKKYRAKAFGGGIVFQAVNLEEKIQYMVDKVNEVNSKEGKQ